MGQGNAGKGHDAFDGVPYERLNQIRILSAEMNARQFNLVADATAAYQPEVGVTKFIRRFSFTAPDKFEITDDIAMSEPRSVTSYLHADETIEQLSPTIFLVKHPRAELLADIIAPASATVKVEPNLLIAPGRPGAVDKGETETRGNRLAITTKEKTRAINLTLRLTISPKSKV